MLDITKVMKMLNWQPKLNLYTAIKWIVDWYKAWLNQEDMRTFTLSQIAQYEAIKKVDQTKRNFIYNC